MSKKEIKQIDSIEDFTNVLRAFQNWDDSDYVYDVNLIVRFIIALLENLQTNASTGDLENAAYVFNDSQRSFLREFTQMITRFSDADLYGED